VDLVARALAEPGTAAPDLYLCGPPPLVDAVQRAAVAAGVPADRVYRERFLAG
jgi:ferredoxin-NADP reductase